MANLNAPFGFRPAMLRGGRQPNFGLTKYRLASGTASNIFIGDPVKFLTTGYIDKAGASDQLRGVVWGLRWLDTSGLEKRGPYWPTGTTTYNAQDADILVIDDPDVMFEVQYANSTSAPAKADLGATFQTYFPSPAGNTATGQSYAGLDYTTLNTTSQCWRLIDFSTKPDNDSTSAYTRCFVQPALHDFRVNTGI